MGRLGSDSEAAPLWLAFIDFLAAFPPSSSAFRLLFAPEPGKEASKRALRLRDLYHRALVVRCCQMFLLCVTVPVASATCTTTHSRRALYRRVLAIAPCHGAPACERLQHQASKAMLMPARITPQAPPRRAGASETRGGRFSLLCGAGAERAAGQAVGGLRALRARRRRPLLPGRRTRPALLRLG